MRALGVAALALLTTGCELGGGLVNNVASEQASPGLPELDGTFTESFDEDEGRWPVTSASEPTETPPAPTDGPPPGEAVFEYRDGAYVVEAGAGRHLVPTAPVTYSSDADITVSAGERYLTFTVNGEVVAEGTDREAPTEPAQVSAGMVIDTSSLPPGRPFVVRFNDFELREAD